MAQKRVPCRPRNQRPGARPAASVAIPKPILRRTIARDSRLRVLVAGASGLIGTQLVQQLTAAGRTVSRCASAAARRGRVHWAPDAKILDFRLLESVDAVDQPLRRLPQPRPVDRPLQGADPAVAGEGDPGAGRGDGDGVVPPPVFLSSSAVGFYGDRPGETLTEESPRGTGFLADVVTEWEGAAGLAPVQHPHRAAPHGCGARTRRRRAGAPDARDPLRVRVDRRPRHAALALDRAARRGGGHRAPAHLSSIEGPVNLVGPTPATSEEITRRLAAGPAPPARAEAAGGGRRRRHG